MAHTFRNLWPRLLSWDNLLLAYRRCRRGKRSRPDAARFDFEWEANLLALRRELESGTYVPGAYRHFYIHDPKKRRISAAPFRDRVVHHALVNVLEPLYDKERLWQAHEALRQKLAGCRLLLHKDKTHLRPCRLGLNFLGMVVRRDGLRLQQRGLARLNRTLRRYRWLRSHGLASADQPARSLQAWLAHARHANALGIRRAILGRANRSCGRARFLLVSAASAGENQAHG